MRRYGPYTVSGTGVVPAIALPGTPNAASSLRFLNFSQYTILATIAGLQPIVLPEATTRVDLGGAFQWDGSVALTTELDLSSTAVPVSNRLWIEAYGAGEAMPQVDPAALTRTIGAAVVTQPSFPNVVATAENVIITAAVGSFQNVLTYVVPSSAVAGQQLRVSCAFYNISNTGLTEKIFIRVQYTDMFSGVGTFPAFFAWQPGVAAPTLIALTGATAMAAAAPYPCLPITIFAKTGTIVTVQYEIAVAGGGPSQDTVNAIIEQLA